MTVTVAVRLKPLWKLGPACFLGQGRQTGPGRWRSVSEPSRGSDTRARCAALGADRRLDALGVGSVWGPLAAAPGWGAERQGCGATTGPGPECTEDPKAVTGAQTRPGQCCGWLGLHRPPRISCALHQPGAHCLRHTQDCSTWPPHRQLASSTRLRNRSGWDCRRFSVSADRRPQDEVSLNWVLGAGVAQARREQKSHRRPMGGQRPREAALPVSVQAGTPSHLPEPQRGLCTGSEWAAKVCTPRGERLACASLGASGRSVQSAPPLCHRSSLCPSQGCGSQPSASREDSALWSLPGCRRALWMLSSSCASGRRAHSAGQAPAVRGVYGPSCELRSGQAGPAQRCRGWLTPLGACARAIGLHPG